MTIDETKQNQEVLYGHIARTIYTVKRFISTDHNDLECNLNSMMADLIAIPYSPALQETMRTYGQIRECLHTAGESLIVMLTMLRALDKSVKDILEKDLSHVTDGDFPTGY